MTVLPGLTDLGGVIPWINDKIIAMLRSAPMESLPFLQASLMVAHALSKMNAIKSPPAAQLIASRAAKDLIRSRPESDIEVLTRAVRIDDGSVSRGVTAVADGAYINHKRHATYIEDLRARNPSWRSSPAESVFSAGMHQDGLRDESASFARFKLGVAALADLLEAPGRRPSTPTRAVVSAITRAGDEPGAWASVLKDRAFGQVGFGGFVEPAPEIRKAQWLQRNPQFQRRGVAIQGAA